jgi:methylglyoxal synthase
VIDRIGVEFEKSQIDPLLEEMNTAFTKLQNQVLFRKHLANGGDTKKMLSKDLQLDFKKKGSAPYFGRIQLKREKEIVALNLGKIMRVDAKSF